MEIQNSQHMEDRMEFILPLSIFWLICGVGASMIAKSKGYNGCNWLVGGFLLGPIGILIIGFMAPASTRASLPTGPETVLLSEGKVRVTDKRILIGDESYETKKLKTVEITPEGQNRWAINITNLSEEVIHSITSNDHEKLNRIAKAINLSIMTPTETNNVASNIQSTPNGVPEKLENIKQLFESGLITKEDYDQKKAEILSKI